MQRALLAGLLAVAMTSAGRHLGGDPGPDASWATPWPTACCPGIALAFLSGFDLTLGALASAAVMVGGITW